MNGAGAVYQYVMQEYFCDMNGLGVAFFEDGDGLCVCCIRVNNVNFTSATVTVQVVSCFVFQYCYTDCSFRVRLLQSEVVKGIL